MKLLIVDDHAVVREGLSAMVHRAEPSAVVLQAATFAEGLALAESHRDLDAVVLDLKMPGSDGIAAIRDLGTRRPDVPVIVLSSCEDPVEVRRALHAGALGYVPKSASSQTFRRALDMVLSGEKYIPPLLLDHDAFFTHGARNAAQQPGIAQLTPRQADVLKLLVKGLANKEIGDALTLSDKTVKAHVTAIFKALNVVNRTQAANAGRQIDLASRLE
jgi:DNA-binding NarL/FixJ family response regulator